MKHDAANHTEVGWRSSHAEPGPLSATRVCLATQTMCYQTPVKTAKQSMKHVGKFNSAHIHTLSVNCYLSAYYYSVQKHQPTQTVSVNSSRLCVREYIGSLATQ